MLLTVPKTVNAESAKQYFTLTEKLSAKPLERKIIDFSGDVQIQGEIYNQGNQEITVMATVHANIIARCDRCLQEYQFPFETQITEKFMRSHNPDMDQAEEIYVYEGDKLKLDKAITDNILLELPIKMICTEHCKGLCQECGINLNIETCTCGNKASTNSLFASSLRAFLKNDEEV